MADDLGKSGKSSAEMKELERNIAKGLSKHQANARPKGSNKDQGNKNNKKP